MDSSGKAQHYAMVLQANDGATSLELPFIPYFAPWNSTRKAGNRRAEKLWRAIDDLTRPGG